MAELATVSVLVIDANPGMRTQLRAMLGSFGVNGVQFAVSAANAVRKLRGARFDIVLCEFNLGDGQDGQHLLEDLRSQEIIPLSTLFIMVTTERNYERVVGTAELAPNDYVLKPLAAHALRERLQRALDKREIFLPAYLRVEIGDPLGAVELLRQAEADQPRYLTDLLRLQAELLLATGHTDDAQKTYRRALGEKDLPWAQLGLARILFLRKQHGEAEEMIATLVAEREHYIDAYDLLARCREEDGRLELARDALLAASARSPHRVSRLRHLGEVSFQLGEHERAERVLAEVVRKGKVSGFREPEDHVRLLQVQLAQGRDEAARATIRDLDNSMGGHPKASTCAALARGLYYAADGEDEQAREALRTSALAASADGGLLSATLKQELLKACFDNDLETEGSELVLDILRNAADERTLEITRGALRMRGREMLAEELEERTREEVRGLIARGAAKAKAGDYDGAVSEMMSAARRMPGNPHVLFNAALALLRHIEHRGWNERFATQASTLISRARRFDPASPRLAAISGLLHSLFKKFSIAPRGEGRRRGIAV
ncbi:response regulator [Pseudothauera nasutitermitis]|uniref:Response regulator n=1 Tax=Pseudothauera nasutitermitis TaxID=2565930 RepID=A0A4S4AUJ0_9RHOO|nr:response regulator [Pseudothauera nasutitermitis]THF63631.1 response regulator [Pseudothauera nasutitermitis]